MKATTLLLIGAVAVGGYLLWVSSNAAGLQWILQNLSIGASGLTTELNLTMTVQNPGSATVNVTNMLVTATYNGTVMGTGLVSSAIPPGTNSVPITIVMSDFSLLTNFLSDYTNGNASSTVTISGKGMVNSVPASFSTNYSL